MTYPATPANGRRWPEPRTDGSAAAAITSAPPMGPAARRIVAEHGLDPAAIEGSGKDGRITKADALRHLESAVAAAGA